MDTMLCRWMASVYLNITGDLKQMNSESSSIGNASKSFPYNSLDYKAKPLKKPET